MTPSPPIPALPAAPSPIGLVLALLTTVVLLLGAWWVRQQPALESARDLAAAITDGGVDHAERLARFQRLLALGERELAEGDVRSGVLAAAAALELGNREAWERIVRVVAGRSAWLPPGRKTGPEPLPDPVNGPDGAAPQAPWGDQPSEWLGAPYLVSLFSGVAALRAGNSDEAAQHLERARLSAGLSRMTLVVESALRVLEPSPSGGSTGH